MPEKPLEFQLPLEGWDQFWPRAKQPASTTPDVLNVLPEDRTNRGRLAQRPGLRPFFTRLAGTSGGDPSFRPVYPCGVNLPIQKFVDISQVDDDQFDPISKRYVFKDSLSDYNSCLYVKKADPPVTGVALDQIIPKIRRTPDGDPGDPRIDCADASCFDTTTETSTTTDTTTETSTTTTTGTSTGTTTGTTTGTSTTTDNTSTTTTTGTDSTTSTSTTSTTTTTTGSTTGTTTGTSTTTTTASSSSSTEHGPCDDTVEGDVTADGMEGFIGETCGGAATGPITLTGGPTSWQGRDDNFVSWCLGGTYDSETNVCTWRIAYGCGNGPSCYVWKKTGPSPFGAYEADPDRSSCYGGGSGPCDSYFLATTMTVA